MTEENCKLLKAIIESMQSYLTIMDSISNDLYADEIRTHLPHWSTKLQIIYNEEK